MGPCDFFSDGEIAELRRGRVLLLVSGGADSTFLFHFFVGLKSHHAVDFDVLHVNYGLRGRESDADEDFVQRLCDEHGIVCHVRRPMLLQSGNIQNQARRGRLAACFEIQTNEGLAHAVTAHHQDDLIETLVMRKRRGAGLKGLVGISRRRILKNPLQKGRELALWRPLLGVKKSEIVAALNERGLSYRTDSSNATPKYFRNRVRQELAQYPISEASAKRLTCFSRVLSAVDFYYDARLSRFLTHFRHHVPAYVWESWPEELRYRFFKEKMRSKGFYKEIEKRHFAVATRETARLTLGRASFFKDVGGCYFYSEGDLAAFRLPKIIPAPGAYRFAQWDGYFRVCDKFVFPLTLGVAGEFGAHSLKSEFFKPAGATKKVSLKDFYQSRHLPRYARLFTPVLKDAKGQIIAVIGVADADQIKA